MTALLTLVANVQLHMKNSIYKMQFSHKCSGQVQFTNEMVYAGQIPGVSSSLVFQHWLDSLHYMVPHSSFSQSSQEEKELLGQRNLPGYEAQRAVDPRS